MSFEFVRTVDKAEDREKYLELKARHERQYAMLHPPKVEAIEDFRRVVESLKKYGQRDDLIECDYDEKRCKIFGVDSILVNREEEKTVLEVDHQDYKKKFYLELENVMDVDAHRTTRITDVIYERMHGGERPLKRYPDYIVDIHNDRGKCFVHWESRGSYEKGSPYHRQGFEIHCTGMEVDEVLDKFRDRMLSHAMWKLKKLPDEITEEDLRKATKDWIADWLIGSEMLEEIHEEAKR